MKTRSQQRRLLLALVTVQAAWVAGACSGGGSARLADAGPGMASGGARQQEGTGGMRAAGGSGGGPIAPGSGGSGNATPDCITTTATGGASTGGSGVGRGTGGVGAYVKPAAAPSAGCAQASSPGSGRRTISIGGGTRNYVVDATSYTSGMPNRLVFTLHGCGGYVTNGTNLPRLPSFTNVLYVMWQGGDGTCYEDQTRASPEYDVFDALLAEIENTFCIDKNRVFADGFSSGSWMAMMLGCQRANVLKAHGQGAGGLPIAIRPAVDCKGPEAALFSHGTADDQNHIHGSRQDRDRLLRTNQCDGTTRPYGNFPQCVEYQSCLPGYPVVYCEYPGLGHTPATTQDASIAQFFDQF